MCCYLGQHSHHPELQLITNGGTLKEALYVSPVLLSLPATGMRKGPEDSKASDRLAPSGFLLPRAAPRSQVQK